MGALQRRKRVLAKAGGLRGPKAQSQERRWGEAQTRFVGPRGCRCRGHCAACGVAVAVIALCVVSRSQSLGHVGVAGAVAPRVVWCHGCSRCTAWVLRVLSLRRVWCRGHGHALRGLVVAVILLCVMLQSWWLALEGEEGHASVSRGGERWESSGTWHTILKKLASTHNISTSGCG